MVVARLEELTLVVVARPPVQHGADAERLAEDVPHHVLGPDAFGRALVVAAAGGVHVVVAGVPALRRRIDPPREPEFDRGRQSVLGNGDHPALRVVLRTATAP